MVTSLPLTSTVYSSEQPVTVAPPEPYTTDTTRSKTVLPTLSSVVSASALSSTISLLSPFWVTVTAAEISPAVKITFPERDAPPLAAALIVTTAGSSEAVPAAGSTLSQSPSETEAVQSAFAVSVISEQEPPSFSKEQAVAERTSDSVPLYASADRAVPSESVTAIRPSSPTENALKTGTLLPATISPSRFHAPPYQAYQRFSSPLIFSVSSAKRAGLSAGPRVFPSSVQQAPDQPTAGLM